MEAQDRLKIVIASPPDYERLVAEAYIDGQFCFLISQEGAPGVFDVEFPGADDDELMVMRKMPLEFLMFALAQARRGLAGDDTAK